MNKERCETPVKWKVFLNLALYRRFYKNQKRIIKNLLFKVKDSSNQKVLDAGCGFGRYTKILKEYFDVYPVDISKPMVKTTYKQCRKAMVSSVDLLPFCNDCFDTILCVDVTDHLESVENAMIELKRTLKKGGVMIITFGNVASPFIIMNKLVKCVLEFLKLNFRPEISKSYSKFFIKRVLRKNFKEVNIFEIPHFNGFPPTQYVAVLKK